MQKVTLLHMEASISPAWMWLDTYSDNNHNKTSNLFVYFCYYLEVPGLLALQGRHFILFSDAGRYLTIQKKGDGLMKSS